MKPNVEKIVFIHDLGRCCLIMTREMIDILRGSMPLRTVKLFRDVIYCAIKWHPLVHIARFILTGHGAVLTALKAGKTGPTSNGLIGSAAR